MLEKSEKQLLEMVNEKIKEADAIVIGAGSGLSTAAGITYTGKRFEDNFKDFIERYEMPDMYSAGFYPFDTQEERWAYWSRHINLNRYEPEATKVYCDLFELMKKKNNFVLTTNVDHQFWKAGFSNERIFATQGDYGLFQCEKGCHKKLLNNEAEVKAMLSHQKDCRIPKFLVPKCPVCGGEMAVHIRCDGYFIENEDWHAAEARFNSFLKKYRAGKIVFLELGVGMNTPGIIKYPFWKLTSELKHAFYICINKGQAVIPSDIDAKSLGVDGDIAKLLTKLREEK